MVSFPTINIYPRAARRVQNGFLWVYSNDIITKDLPLKPGEWCWFESQGRYVGTGYVNRHSLICGRLISCEKRFDIDVLIRERLTQAFERRDRKELSSMRLVYSEADLLPGIIMDYYSGVGVIQSNTAGGDQMLPFLERAVPQEFERGFGRSLEGLLVKADASVRRLEGLPEYTKIIFGDEALFRNGSFEDQRIKYAANFISGQKTGFFLDQRENRSFLASFVAKKRPERVLDLFCYSGGWGISALMAGASGIDFVDESSEALKLVQQSASLNDFSLERFQIKKAEAFSFLEDDSTPYDVIVSDPPAFAKSKKDLPKALKAYEKLNRLCWRRLKPGGLLLTCSCSYHVSGPDFLHIIRGAVAKEKGLAHLVYQGRQAADHPILLSMPETSYLKCLALIKLS